MKIISQLSEANEINIYMYLDRLSSKKIILRKVLLRIFFSVQSIHLYRIKILNQNYTIGIQAKNKNKY